MQRKRTVKVRKVEGFQVSGGFLFKSGAVSAHLREGCKKAGRREVRWEGGGELLGEIIHFFKNLSGRHFFV